MAGLAERPVSCPYCGERFTLLVDASEPEQDYVEDCEVCCRPIRFRVSVAADGEIGIGARSENEAGE